jgi:hypothetical protein
MGSQISTPFMNSNIILNKNDHLKLLINKYPHNYEKNMIYEQLLYNINKSMYNLLHSKYGNICANVDKIVTNEQLCHKISGIWIDGKQHIFILKRMSSHKLKIWKSIFEIVAGKYTKIIIELNKIINIMEKSNFENIGIIAIDKSKKLLLLSEIYGIMAINILFIR